MNNANWKLYQALLDQSRIEDCLSHLLLGINWSVATLEQNNCSGICFSPTHIPRTNPWAGTLQKRPLNELQEWILHWDAAESVIGALTVNASINSRSALISQAKSIDRIGSPHLVVFNYFRPHLNNKNVVVIGHYPALDPFPEAAQWHCLERNMQCGDFPDAAADFLLPSADWVFITASSIANKTLPRLLQLAANAEVVLMGPSLPWMEGWEEFGVQHLAGVDIVDPEALRQVAAEGGGTRIFDESCCYRVLSL